MITSAAPRNAKDSEDEITLKRHSLYASFQPITMQVRDAGYGRVQNHIVGVGSTGLRAPEIQVGCKPHPWTHVVFIVPLSQLSDSDETPRFVPNP